MIIGIDLGTTNSLVAYFKDGESILIPNEHGDFLTPSVVSLSDNDEIIVGKIAKERQISNPQKTASLFKRTMGTKNVYKLGKKQYFSEELSAFILQSLKEDAERFLGEKVEEAVISVPAYFDDERRSATKKAGELAGLKVERIINEPSAAALACRMEKRKDIVTKTFLSIMQNAEIEDGELEDQIYMIFDFGGGTLDVSLVECFDNVVGVTAVSGNNHLGGSDIDKEIAKEFCFQNNIIFGNLDENTKKIIIKQAEKSKKRLTTEESVVMTVLINDEEKSLMLTNESLIKICKDILQELVNPILSVLKDAQMSMQEIDELILIGGSSKMPIISRYLEMRTGKNPIVIGSPDTMVALGLGIYTGMKERQEEIKDIVMTDICPFTLGVGIYNEDQRDKEYMSSIIERNSVLPCTKKNYYQPLTTTQKTVSFCIYQGEDIYTKNNTYLGKLQINLPKAKHPGDERPIEIAMTYDINGILNVEATIINTNQKCELNIIKENNLSKEQIELKKKELIKIKKENEEDAKNTYLVERAESLFRILNGPLREHLVFYLKQYENVREHGSPLQKKRFNMYFENIMDQLENALDQYGFDTEEIESEEEWDDLLGDSTD